ncbi:MAG TPA: hypothetical protein VFJ16_29055 [Longimicrobium sp.]|nr:hypothetical protein [Longimicrobium sp.]
MHLRLATLVCAALLLAGCRVDPKEAVLGEWRSGASRMLFYPDGQVVMEQDSTASVARYQWLEKRRLRIRALAADPADYGVAVTRDSLVLCAASAPGRCFRLARVGNAGR